MKYVPREEKEIRSSLVIPPGEYDFEVVRAAEKVSKSGNDMIELDLKVFHDAGESYVRDWLVPGSDLGDLKLNRFAFATGLEDIFFNGGLSEAACLGACGKARITISSSEEYGDQNSVKGYVVSKLDAEVEEPPPADPIGVPASQTRRALKNAQSVNDELQQAYQEELAEKGDGIPF